MRQFLTFVIEMLIPAGLTGALILVQRLGLVRLLPLSQVVEREYGNIALLLGVGGALVASGTFTRATHQYGVGGFLATASAALAMAAPFISARYGSHLGLAPAYFDILGTFAYLGFYVAVGLLFGGCWSVILKAMREPRFPEWPRSES